VVVGQIREQVLRVWEVPLVACLVVIKEDKGVQQATEVADPKVRLDQRTGHRHYQLSLPQRPLLLLLLKPYEQPLIFRITSLIFRELHWVNQIPVQPLKDLG
jgi:hypothetical protein